MKYRISIIFLMIFMICVAAQSNPEILEKFKTTNFHNYDELVYDLYLMGDEAFPFLIKSLTDEDPKVRESTIYFLENYYQDARALSALSVVFLHGNDSWMRSKAADIMSGIDAEYTKRLMLKNLNADAQTQNNTINVFLRLKDKRVIPLLVERLEDPKTSPEKKKLAVYALADFKDKRAVPLLLDMLKDPDIIEVVEKLAGIDDKRAIPVLLNIFDPNSSLAKRGSNILVQKVTTAMSQSGQSSLQALLESLKQTESEDVRRSILRVIRNVRDPKLAPFFAKVYLETADKKENFALKSAIVEASKNMGTAGLENLLRFSRQKPNAAVLTALTSFNKKAAVDTVAAFALDRSSPLRYNAIGSLARFGSLHKAEISKYIPQLLADSTPKVKLLVLYLIRQMKLTEVAPALKQLTQDPDENIRNAAHIVLDILSGKTQLKLEVEPDQQQYDYGQPINLTYRLINVSKHPIKIIIVPNIRLTEELDIQKPDGTSATYKGIHADFAGPRRDDYKTLLPGDELTGTITVSQSTHWLHQIGRYTVNLHIIPWGGGIGYGFIALPYRISSKVQVDINPPTKDEVDAILERVDANNFGDVGRTYHQLCELNKSGLFPALKTRALIPLDKFGRYEPTSVAQWLGGKFIKLSKTELVTKCIEMIGEDGMVQVLTAIGDERAIEPMQMMAIIGSADAAFALQQFGDDKFVKWCSELAKRGLLHWKKEERVEAAETLRTLQQPSHFKPWSREHRNALTVQGFYEKNESPELTSNWAEIIEKAVTIPGLKALLKHEIPAVRRGAAYELAYLGDKSGVHLVEEDLHANDVETRMHARKVLSELKSK